MIIVHDLYPHLSDSELAESEENLDRYIDLALRIFERIEREGEESRILKSLTVDESKATIQNSESSHF